MNIKFSFAQNFKTGKLSQLIIFLIFFFSQIWKTFILQQWKPECSREERIFKLKVWNLSQVSIHFTVYSMQIVAHNPSLSSYAITSGFSFTSSWSQCLGCLLHWSSITSATVQPANLHQYFPPVLLSKVVTDLRNSAVIDLRITKIQFKLL